MSPVCTLKKKRKNNCFFSLLFSREWGTFNFVGYICLSEHLMQNCAAATKFIYPVTSKCYSLLSFFLCLELIKCKFMWLQTHEQNKWLGSLDHTSSCSLDFC